MDNTPTSSPETLVPVQHEDAALKTVMQFFADELLPYLGIKGTVVSAQPTELVHLEIRKFFQDFNFAMDDGTWKHFEFQSKNEGKKGLRRFRSYEALASYQHNVAVTTYVLFSGNIRNPMTELKEGINTYRIVPIILKDKNADTLIAALQEKIFHGQPITKEDLVPLTLCALMDGKMKQLDRFKAAYTITRSAAQVTPQDSQKIQSVIYALAEKFLDDTELNELQEVIKMTRLGQMLVNEGKQEAKIEAAKNLLDLLDEQTISERIGLPLETVQKLKEEFLAAAK